ncbi:MAG: type II toxin-antitoxin system prevent-host-death family antitoxin [Phenylobacterium sp.]|uniref:type II toxin-antitoxin system Phd/YefM family antitoxin n=1 Tax=Phenylobacterium sp. TaxID=1871053 RepID=UPI003BB803E2
MEVLTFSDLQARLEEVLERVVKGRASVLVTRKEGEAVVLVSLAEFEAGDATRHLMASRANAERLAEAIAQLRSGEAG